MDKQDTRDISDSIVKLLCESPRIRGGDGFLTSEISLLPIIAELEQASAIDGEDAKNKRVNDLDLRIISTMVYAIGNRISSVRVLPGIMKECSDVIDIVREDTIRYDCFTPGERVNYLGEFQSFCKELVKWAQESISVGDIDQTEVLKKFNSYLNLLKRGNAMLSLYAKELHLQCEKALLRKETEQREKAVRQREGPGKSFLLSLFDECMASVQIPLTEESARTPARGQNGKTGSGPKKKHSDEKCKNAAASYDEFNAASGDFKEAWSKVAKHHGFESWRAAKQAVYRWRKKREQET